MRSVCDTQMSKSPRDKLIPIVCFAAALLPLPIACLLPAFARGEETPAQGLSAKAAHAMVVSVSRPASEAGLAVLKNGGSAVDAAVAVAFALAVTWPEAGNIGGGGFMLVHPGNKQDPTVFDYRERAPAAATRDMFAAGVKTQYALVGVPGTVRGLELAHRRFGKRPWGELVSPAIRLAIDGIDISEELAASLNSGIKRAGQDAGHDVIENTEFRRVFGKQEGKLPWAAGDRLIQPDLAKTLQRIATTGADGFYAGESARLLEQEMTQGGGLITRTDLAGYEAKERKPIHCRFREFDVYGPPPPSSGGVCLSEMLNMAEKLDLRRQGRWSRQTLHLMVECMRRAYCDRAQHLGDPDFAAIPVASLVSKAHAEELAATISLTKPTPSEQLAPGISLETEGTQTTHFSIIDAEGMAVANTYTLEESFGSRIVVRGAGYLLNNEMGDFNPRPGITTRSGKIGTLPNLVAPGKRMLSSMCPVVVAQDGRAVLITGSPGGRTIINTVFCVLVNVLEFGMPLREAVDAPRHHHQWFPDLIRVETSLRTQHDGALKSLEEIGHTIDRAPYRQGDAHSIAVDAATGERTGVADRRRNGWAAGD